jgi:hypothetical protein
LPLKKPPRKVDLGAAADQTAEDEGADVETACC